MPQAATPFTPPVGLINGLAASIAMLQAEGLDNVYARHHRLAEATRRAVGGWGLQVCAARLTCIPTP